MKFIKKFTKYAVDPFLGKGKYGWINPAGKIAHLTLRPLRKALVGSGNSALSISGSGIYGQTGSIVGRY